MNKKDDLAKKRAIIEEKKNCLKLHSIASDGSCYLSRGTGDSKPAKQ